MYPSSSKAETFQTRCSFPDIELFVKVSIVKESDENIWLWRAYYYIWDSFDSTEESGRASRTGFINVCCLQALQTLMN